MAFKVETTKGHPHFLIACQGHLDSEAMAAVERELAAAEAAGLRAVIRVCRGASADRTVVARLAGYPVERLEVESPFLRSWLEELRATCAQEATSSSGEHIGSGSEMS